LSRMKKVIFVCFVLIITGCQSKYKKMIDKQDLKGLEESLVQDNEKLEDTKKENAIKLKKIAKIVKGSPFGMERNIIITDLHRSNNIGEIKAHSARIDRINTGTFEFYGIYNISDERATLKITNNTKFFFLDLKQEEAKKVFYETISKPSSYYLVVIDNDAEIKEIRRFTSHIYYTAEELHNDIYPNEGY